MTVTRDALGIADGVDLLQRLTSVAVELQREKHTVCVESCISILIQQDNALYLFAIICYTWIKGGELDDYSREIRRYY